MLKALFWKEWRESRLLLVIWLLLMVCFSLLHGFYALILGYYGGLSLGEFLSIFSLIFFAVLMGAHAFSNEEARLTFLLSMPVRKQTIVTVKLFTGLLNILIIFLIVVGINFPLIFPGNKVLVVLIPVFNTTYGGFFIYYYPLILWLFYSLSFFTSSLFLNVPTSVLIGVLGTWYIISGLNLLFKKWDLSQSWNIFLLVLSFVILFLSFLSYFIFIRREVRH